MTRVQTETGVQAATQVGSSTKTSVLRAKTKRHARGMSTWGMMGVAGMAGFCALFAIKLAPIYIENFSVKSVIETLEEEEDMLREARKKDIQTTMLKRFTVNQVSNVRKEHITIKKTKEDISVQVQYEVRVPLISNIDIVPYFQHEFVKKF